MKHKFNHSGGAVDSNLAKRGRNVPRRKLLDGKRAAFHTELALRSERSNIALQLEIPIMSLARASRKHMRAVAALTEKMRTKHRVANRLAVDPKLPAEMAR
jgi:hypothetical protein